MKIYNRNGVTTMERSLVLKLGQLFKIVHNMFFTQEIVKFRKQTTLLNSLYLHQPRAHTNSYKYSFVPHTILLWNYLTFELGSASSFFKVFKYFLYNK